MANSINHKHIVGGLHISYNIERAFPDTSHSNIVDSECIFGLFDKNDQTIIEASAKNGYAYIPNMQLYDGHSYHNIHTYVSGNIHRLNVELSEHKIASNNTHNSITTYLNNSYNWLRKYVLDAYTYSYNSDNNILTYVLTTYTNLINAYTNLKSYTTSNVARLDGKIDGLLETKDALVFRGTVQPGSTSSTSTNSVWTKVASDSQLITSAGSTFKVIQTGYFFNKKVFAGSLIISNKDNANSAVLNDWILVDTHVGNLGNDSTNASNSSNTYLYISNIKLQSDGTLSYTFSKPLDKLKTSKSSNIPKKEITYVTYANVVTGVNIDNSGILTYSVSDFYIDAVNKAEMSEYAKLSDLSEFAKGSYGLTKLIGNSNAGNKVVTNLYLETGTGYLTYDYTQLSASKNSGLDHDLKNGAITVVTGISQGGNGKITYHYQQISNSYNHHENNGASGTANHSITNINISNTGKLTYVYRDLSTTTGAATSATATNVISNEIKVLTGLSQTSDGKITYTYTPIKGTHNHSHNHTYSFKFDSSSNGAHTHNLTGASAVSNGAHTHTLTGTADSNGAHTHNITYTGTSSSNGSHNHTFTGNSNTTSSISGTTSVATAAHTHSTSSSGDHTPAGTVTLSGSETDGVLTIIAIFTGTAVSGHTHTANATTDNTTNRVSVASSSHTHTLTPTGTIADAGSHSHTYAFKFDSTSNGAHTHTVTGTVDSNGAHTHSISYTGTTTTNG